MWVEWCGSARSKTTVTQLTERFGWQDCVCCGRLNQMRFGNLLVKQIQLTLIPSSCAKHNGTCSLEVDRIIVRLVWRSLSQPLGSTFDQILTGELILITEINTYALQCNIFSVILIIAITIYNSWVFKIMKKYLW